MKIKSAWLDDGNNTYKKMGREEGLNLYLQLFRFRLYQGDPNEHLFRTSLIELCKFTRINHKKRLTIKQVVELLLKMESVGVIKIHTPGIENMIGNEMLIVEATDIPKLERVDGKDKIIDEDYYTTVNFKTVDYIYNELGFTAKEVAFYILLSRYGLRKGESKTTMKINNMKDRLGTRNDKITEMIIKFNQCGLAATRVIHDGKKTKFEHFICQNVDKIEQFKRDTERDRLKYLKRHEDKIKKGGV